MSRKSVQFQQAEATRAHHPGPAPANLANLTWAQLRSLASERGVLRQGMDRKDIEAALQA